MSGVAVRADPGALDRFAEGGWDLVDRFDPIVRSVLRFQADVRGGCGARAAAGEGTDRLLGLLTHIGDTAAEVAHTRRALLAADAPSAGLSLSGLSLSGLSLSDLSLPGRSSLGPVVGPRPSAAGTGPIPWTDPDTDSWVIGLLRAGVEGRPSDVLLDRLRADLPGIAADLTDTEMGAANQVRLLVTEPELFAANWRRAGSEAVSATAAVGWSAAGLAAALAPGLDDSIEAAIGRRPGDELLSAARNAGRSLVYDPDALAASAIGWDLYRRDPYRWSGGVLPDLVFEGATAALPLASGRRAVSTLVDGAPPPRHTAPGALDLSALDGRASVAGPLPDLAEVRRAEAEWGPTDPIRSHRAEPFEAPERWVRDINGDGPGAPGRRANCIDCARAVEANWRGDDAVAAPLADPDALGLPPDRLEDWTGGSFVPASMDEIGERLTELGPGSSALVTSAWDSGGAHAYNALNDGGTIKWVDGQLGITTTWPPPYAKNVDLSIVIFLDGSGSPR